MGLLLLSCHGVYGGEAKLTLADSLKVSLQYELELSDTLQQILNTGIPLYFDSEIQIQRTGWLWQKKDNSWWQSTKHATKSAFRWFSTSHFTQTHTQRLNKNILQGDYRVTRDGFWQSFTTLSEALDYIRKPALQNVVESSDLQSGAIYSGVARLQIDINKLPKPFQLEALGNDSLELLSREILFEFEVPEK